MSGSRMIKAIETISSRKRASRIEPTHAMESELASVYKELYGTTEGLSEDLASALKSCQVLQHPTINSTSYTVSGL